MKKCQSTLEYAVILAVVVAALVAMQMYMKRAAQGKIRQSADQIGRQFSADGTSYTRNSVRTGGVTTEASINGQSSYTVNTPSTTTSAYQENVETTICGEALFSNPR